MKSILAYTHGALSIWDFSKGEEFLKAVEIKQKEKKKKSWKTAAENLHVENVIASGLPRHEPSFLTLSRFSIARAPTTALASTDRANFP